MNLKNIKIVLKDFKGDFVNEQILTNQYLSEDIYTLN